MSENSWVSNLKGATGATGPTGSTGATGATGPAGATGPGYYPLLTFEYGGVWSSGAVDAGEFMFDAAPTSATQARISVLNVNAVSTAVVLELIEAGVIHIHNDNMSVHWIARFDAVATDVEVPTALVFTLDGGWLQETGSITLGVEYVIEVHAV